MHQNITKAALTKLCIEQQSERCCRFTNTETKFNKQMSSDKLFSFHKLHQHQKNSIQYQGNY